MRCWLGAFVLGLQCALAWHPSDVKQALAVCAPALRIAAHRSQLPLIKYSSAIAQSPHCLDDLIGEGHAEAGNEDLLCPGSRVVRSLLAECMWRRRIERVYSSYPATSAIRSALRDLERDGFAVIRADKLQLIQLQNKQFSENQKVREQHSVDVVAELLWHLHGHMQEIKIRQHSMDDSGDAEDFFQHAHFDSIFPLFKAWVYTHDTCSPQAAIQVQPGSHHLTASKIWWVHDGRSHGTQPGGDFARRMLANRKGISPQAHAWSGATSEMTTLCGSQGDVALVDTRTVHARGRMSRGQHRTTWMLFPGGDPKSRIFRAFVTTEGAKT